MCGVGGVGQGPSQGMPNQVAGATGPGQEPPSKVAGASGSAEQAPPSKVAGTSGGGASGGMSDVLAQIMEAVKALETLVGGITGGGPSGKPTQVAGDAGKGAGQVGQQPVVQQTTQGGGPGQVGGQHGEHRFGPHSRKPGWGNGGFGPPGLMKKGNFPGQFPGQMPGQVGGQSGPGGKPGQVGGESGPAKPADVVPAPAPAPVKPTEVAGENGPGKPGQVGGESGPAMPVPIDPKSLVEVAAPQGAPTTDKDGSKIHYFTHPGDPEPRPMSEAMMKYFGIGA